MPRVMTAVICLAATAACTSSAADEKPTLTEAAKALTADADRLLSSKWLTESGKVQVTERLDQDRPCTPGKAQRFFRAEGDFLRPDRQSPGSVAGSIENALANDMDYEKIVDDLDLREEDISITVLRNAKTAVTFIITARTSKPNILIVGKTDCLEP